MKTSILLSLLFAGVSSADFATWTNKDGKEAKLDLVSVVDSGGERTGKFKMSNGKIITIKASELSEADATKLRDWTPPASEAVAKPSVFDDLLDGNLVKLDGKSLKRYKDGPKPTKYYMFYYTASWCGPCQKFTPSLVEFYDKHKPDSDEFEIVLVTSDTDEDDMEDYAVEKGMNWPQLKLSKTAKFKKKIKHPGGGIPNLVLTDLDGKIIKSSYEGKKYLGPGVVMNHLGTLLDK